MCYNGGDSTSVELILSNLILSHGYCISTGSDWLITESGCQLDCKTAVFFANVLERSSNARSGANATTKSETFACEIIAKQCPYNNFRKTKSEPRLYDDPDFGYSFSFFGLECRLGKKKLSNLMYIFCLGCSFLIQHSGCELYMQKKIVY